MKRLQRSVPHAHRHIAPEWQRFAERVVSTAGVLDETTAAILIAAFAAVARDKFVESSEGIALEDRALPIGYGQVTSTPSLIARMLGLVGLRPGMRVLEVGCGSGYCSAVMAAAGAQVLRVGVGVQGGLLVEGQGQAVTGGPAEDLGL